MFLRQGVGDLLVHALGQQPHHGIVQLPKVREVGGDLLTQAVNNGGSGGGIVKRIQGAAVPGD